jgi:hypothetical protein
MSSWCRSIGVPVARVVSITLALLASARAAAGAEVYLQPQADALVEVDTNRNLATSSAERFTSEGFGAQAGATLGIVTPTSDSTIRGRLGYLDYPKDSDHELQGTLDLANTFTWERSEFSLLGQFDHMNTFSSELASATFNPIVPISPTTPETARLSVDTNRTMASLEPKYDYRLTQRLKVGVSAILQTTEYSGTFASDYTSFNYGQASAFVGYSLTPRLDLSVGPYISRDTPKGGSSNANGTATDGTGATVSLDYRISKTFNGRIDVTGEGDSSQLPGVTGKVHTHAFGASYTSIWNGQISSVQASVGRTLTPSGSGGEYYADQIQVEYDRKLSQRLSLVSAARFIRYTASISEQGTDAPYKYIDATVALKWLVTRTWYVNGGVEFVRVDYGNVAGVDIQGLVVNGAANNGRLYVGFGYEGLGKRP